MNISILFRTFKVLNPNSEPLCVEDVGCLRSPRTPIHAPFPLSLAYPFAASSISTQPWQPWRCGCPWPRLRPISPSPTPSAPPPPPALLSRHSVSVTSLLALPFPVAHGRRRGCQVQMFAPLPTRCGRLRRRRVRPPPCGPLRQT